MNENGSEHGTNEVVWSPRDHQIAFASTIAVLVVTYFVLTSVFPFIIARLRVASEKSKVIQSIESEVQDDEFDVNELIEYKDPIVEAARATAEAERRNKKRPAPSFQLNHAPPAEEFRDETSNSNDGKLSLNDTSSSSARSNRKMFQLPVRTGTAPVRPLAGPNRTAGTRKSNGETSRSMKSKQSQRMINRNDSNENLAVAPSSSSSQYLQGPAPDSIESRVHASLMGGVGPLSTVQPYPNLAPDPVQATVNSADQQQRLHEQQRQQEQEQAARAAEAARQLREQQDREYQRSLLEEQEQQQHTAVLLRNMAEQRARTQTLQEKLKPEPPIDKEAGIVTLSFRLKTRADSSHSSSSNNSSSSSSSSSSDNSGSNNFKRINRRFRSREDSVESILDFIELVLRGGDVSTSSSSTSAHGDGGTCTGYTGSFELSLDFPTRVISRTDPNTSSTLLQDLEIQTDSVVWVTLLD
mmetsp:Transcript_16593/g.28089  ORF Transcript_16593/g.28089 Transcript_16593/m.28089 type:complete len:469 (+) Transcript_16593:97-1503(+)